MKVSITIDVPSSNNHTPKVEGYVVDGLSGTRSDQDFQGELLELEGAMTGRGMDVEMPEGSLVVVAVKRTKRHTCDLRVLFRADGTSGEASLDPDEQTTITTRGASVVVAAMPGSKWGASWEPILAVLKDVFPITKKRKLRQRGHGSGGYPNMGTVQYRCPECDGAIDRATGSGHAPGCTFRA